MEWLQPQVEINLRVVGTRTYIGGPKLLARSQWFIFPATNYLSKIDAIVAENTGKVSSIADKELRVDVSGWRQYYRAIQLPIFQSIYNSKYILIRKHTISALFGYKPKNTKSKVKEQ